MIVDLNSDQSDGEQEQCEEKKAKKKVKVTKKRRRDEDDEEQKRALLHQARGICSDAQEFQTVRKYKVSKLKDWVEMRQFERDRAVGQGMVGRGVQVLGHVIDKVTRGEGYVVAEIQQDEALLECVQSELGDFIKYLNNRIRLCFLLVNDIAAGLAKKPRDKESPIIELEKEQVHVDCTTSAATYEIPAAGQLHPELFTGAEGETEEIPSQDPGADLAGEENRTPVATE